jgi:hypothetical protein
MSETTAVVAVLTALGAMVLFSAVRYVQELRVDWNLWLQPALAAGGGIGAAVGVAERTPFHPEPRWLVPVLLAAAVWFTRERRPDADVTEGAFSGAIAGCVAAAVASVLATETAPATVTTWIIAGTMAGVILYCVAVHSRLVRLAVGMLAAAVLLLLHQTLAGWTTGRSGWTPAIVMSIVAVGALVITVARWPGLRAELREEAELGFISREDAASVTHPIRRLRLSNWNDPDARREFVRTASDIAVRKRRQRHMSQATARLYQLEILKLRMQLQEMQQVDAAVGADAFQASRERQEASDPSDTMPDERETQQT